jgi:dihydrofolate reductase
MRLVGFRQPDGAVYERPAQARLLAELADGRLEQRSITRRPLEDEISELKRKDGRDIACFGGGRIAHSLIRGHLVDEFRLTVHPVMLGAGLSLMHGLPEPQRLELVSSTTYADGSTTQVLKPT